ncbi:hypothetical protein EVJ58_g10915 [Rhodofomes roseus]|uniref:Uncharacterized protein n=1 Tax=Rhodofomes roseus TaxID=34475 RepID=A0A4Y9XNE8_9APHY|nr:hypothetical protein EVJ58_g10915 [Rhodofomes roseus]
MPTPIAVQYQRDGTPVLHLDMANVTLAEGEKLMKQMEAQLRQKMGGVTPQSSGPDGVDGTPSAEELAAMVVTLESIKKLSRPELEALAIALHKAYASQAREMNILFRVFFELVFHARDLSATDITVDTPTPAASQMHI